MEFAYREVHVADAAARAILLAGNLAVLREEFFQAGEQFFKIERTRIIATRSDNGQHSRIITGACLATIDKRATGTVPRPQTVIRAGCILHTLKGLQICRKWDINFTYYSTLHWVFLPLLKSRLFELLWPVYSSNAVSAPRLSGNTKGRKNYLTASPVTTADSFALS